MGATRTNWNTATKTGSIYNDGVIVKRCGNDTYLVKDESGKIKKKTYKEIKGLPEIRKPLETWRLKEEEENNNKDIKMGGCKREIEGRQNDLCLAGGMLSIN
ncbi:hypothetical protein NEMIN01_1106 [Nematocida minor]|uniref:uncharacterized protein n=1 Tax=Nematocida minor TaxID=1912983 RepID=UPI00221EA126|nr:uncharacterized protein NEMIN01_1106 [Nematocida minor]KAI5190568.1 hypothetical protein NEMIN01_1106 [Nematocida minor]